MKRDQHGLINSLMIPLILVCLLFVAATVFAIWAFNSRQVYKNSTDQKVAAAVKLAEQQTQTSDAQQFAQEAKQPLKTYTGPEAYGSIIVKYPKTWSAYVNEDGSSNTPIAAYFQPDFVPSITNSASVFALEIQVNQETYSQAAQQYSSQATQGLVTVTPYTLPKLPSVVGLKVSGQIQPNIQGTMVILPLRAETLELWTESSQYETDFNDNILPNFTFSP